MAILRRVLMCTRMHESLCEVIPSFCLQDGNQVREAVTQVLDPVK